MPRKDGDSESRIFLLKAKELHNWLAQKDLVTGD